MTDIEKRKELNIIDCSSIIHQSFHSKYRTGNDNIEGVPVDGLFKIFTIVTNVLMMDGDVALCLDSRSFRKDIIPDYKGKRAKTNAEIIVQLVMIEKMLEALEVPFYKDAERGLEADDLIFNCVEDYHPYYNIIKIHSGDYDLAHNIRDDANVTMEGTALTKNVSKYNYQDVLSKKSSDIEIVFNTKTPYNVLLGDSDLSGVFKCSDASATEMFRKYVSICKEYNMTGLQSRDRTIFTKLINTFFSLTEQEKQDFETRCDIFYPKRVTDLDCKIINSDWLFEEKFLEFLLMLNCDLIKGQLSNFKMTTVGRELEPYLDKYYRYIDRGQKAPVVLPELFNEIKSDYFGGAYNHRKRINRKSTEEIKKVSFGDSFDELF